MPIPKNNTSAERLFEGAQGYCDSMEVLVARPNKSSVDAIGLLASHSLELALKSFLITKGWAETDLRDKKKMGHDLKKVWRKAAKLGLDIALEPPYWVRVLDLGHAYPYVYRYPQNNTAVAIPPIDELIPEIKRIIELIKTSIQLT